jgi:hypothetical protein
MTINMENTTFTRQCTIGRRDFVKIIGASIAGSALAGGFFGRTTQAGQFTGKIKKAIQLHMVAGDMPLTVVTWPTSPRG